VSRNQPNSKYESARQVLGDIQKLKFQNLKNLDCHAFRWANRSTSSTGWAIAGNGHARWGFDVPLPASVGHTTQVLVW
jgi:hypothetical protein